MLTATDVFAGYGGTSVGIEAAGITVVCAINHNPIALHSHTLNHPDTLHIRDNALKLDPRLCPKTDLLTLSPECRRHSISATRTSSNPNQPSLWSDELPDTAQSRATMFAVQRFTRELRPKAVIVENVIQAATKWEFFPDWLRQMTELGYRHRLLCLNAAHFGVPQRRERLFAVFWQTHLPEPDLEPHPTAHCPLCDRTVHTHQTWKKPDTKLGIWPFQYSYNCENCQMRLIPDMPPATDVLDLDLPAPTMKERAARGRPLAPKTQARIQRALKHPKTQGRSFVAAYYSTGDVIAPIDQPLPTITTRDRHMLVIPDETRAFANCRARMLQPTELLPAMGLPKTYKLVGTKKQQLTQIGNAVAAPVMTWIVRQLIPTLSA